MHNARRHAAASAATASILEPINKKLKNMPPPPAKSKGKAKAKASDDKPKRSKASPAPEKPPDAVKPDSDGQESLLQSRGSIDADESYGEHERALSEFLRLHPMLSLESCNEKTLQLVSNLLDECCIPTVELETVPKSYDDAQLRAPNLSIGERPCALGNRCVCVWLARWRYGEDTDNAFIGTEFLLPSQRAVFEQDGIKALPTPPGKCLLCSRYYTNYLYKLARSDPSFNANTNIPIQAYSNTVGEARGNDVPSNASACADADGYRPSAMLFIDEAFTNSSAARGPMATLLWRPVMGFNSSHYVYVRDQDTNEPRIIQVGVGSNDVSIERLEKEHDTQNFRRPAPSKGSKTPA